MLKKYSVKCRCCTRRPCT